MRRSLCETSSSEEEESYSTTSDIFHGGPRRRNSVSDDLGHQHLFLVNIAKTRARILRREDTDNDERVTIDDKGPKHIKLKSLASGGYFKRSIRGNYAISSLLQELALLDSNNNSSAERGRELAVISGSQFMESPVLRITRLITKHFWPALRRSVDEEGIQSVCNDPKDRTSSNRQHHRRIYVPHSDLRAFEYFTEVANRRSDLALEVIKLPIEITAEYIQSINDKPGILSLDLEEVEVQGTTCIKGKPYMVPGGRFNEMYGWDSYFIALGLLRGNDELQPDQQRRDNGLFLAKSMVENLIYQINHYGKILNANRSYYLLRSQPPFLTDMAIRVYERLKIIDPEGSDQWLEKAMRAAIKEYRMVWMSEPRWVASVGLSRFYGEGKGIPPETEVSHFDSVLKPVAQKHNISLNEFIDAYNKGEIQEVELDEYFMHDRAVRESGHDTTYRLDGRAAHLLTIDLCALLYKYESDIEWYLSEFGELNMDDGMIERMEEWKCARLRRKSMADTWLWNEEKGMYFDYDFIKKEQSTYESVTTFYALWAGMCSTKQAELMVKNALPLFEEGGGVVSGTKRSLHHISLDKPNRQWDYPFGWAPHQIILWTGLEKYGFRVEQRRLAYRWLYMITKAFSDYNGVVPEKFNVVKLSHRMNVEYGNVGTEFKQVPREGFGWMNSSYLVGLDCLTFGDVRALGVLAPPESRNFH